MPFPGLTPSDERHEALRFYLSVGLVAGGVFVGGVLWFLGCVHAAHWMGWL